MKSLNQYKLQLKLATQFNPVVAQLRKEGWTFKVSKSYWSSWCRYSTRTITIAKSALDNYCGEGYCTYIISHECSHAIAGYKANHGPEFMKVLISICPPEYLHYEVDYKPQNAARAGISSDAHINIIKHGDMKEVIAELEELVPSDSDELYNF